MITIICATHRPKNQTKAVVDAYQNLLEKLGEQVEVLEMSTLPEDFVYNGSFGRENQQLKQIVEEKITAASRFVIIAPEYNGSYPGIFKSFIDVVHPSNWKGKKVALVGVAGGRAGNLRGLDHLTDVMHYVRAEVFSLKIPISLIDDLVKDGELHDADTLKVLEQQAKEFLNY